MVAIIDRVRGAIDGLRRGRSTQRNRDAFMAQTVFKAMLAVEANPGFWEQAEAEWRMYDYETFAKEGFERNALIYSALMFKVRAISQSPLRAYQDKQNPVLLPSTHRLAQLIERPNPDMSAYAFQSMMTIYKNLAGNAYAFLDRPSISGFPEQIIPIRPDYIQLIFRKNRTIFDRDYFMGYLYSPPGNEHNPIPILPGDMMHNKFPNPLDPHGGKGYGLSPIFALARSADVDNAVTEFIKVFWQHGANPPAILTADRALTDEQVQSAKERFMQIYGGFEEWMSVAVLDNGMKYERIGWNFKEMGFAEIDERNEARILGPLGVPAILIGARLGLKHATFSNADALMQLFWENTMIPELLQDETEYQHYLTDGNAFVRFDVHEIPAIRRQFLQQVDAAFRMFQMGTPGNDALRAAGIHMPSLPAGDTAYIPAGMLPVGSDNSDAIDGEEVDDDSEDDDLKRLNLMLQTKTEASLKRTGEQVIDATDGHLNAFEDAARDALEEDRKQIMAIVNGAAKAARRSKASITWTGVEGEIVDYLQSKGAENWRSVFTPLIEGVIADVGTIWAAELGVTFDVRNIQGEAWFSDYTLRFAQPINDTTKTNIQMVLAQGQAEGWSIETMENHLELVFQQYIDGDLSAEDFEWFSDRMPAYRREMIARTETTRAAGAGAHNLLKDWGVQERKWLATTDDRTRDSHAAANQQKAKIDEPFKVGGYDMMYPGDASLGAPPSEFVDCRCTVIPVVVS